MAKGYDFLAKWDGEQLVHAWSIDLDTMRRLAPGTLIACKLYRDTDKASRWLHVMLNIAVENSFGWTSELIKNDVKIRYGWVTGAVVAADGTTHLQLRSTASFDRDELGKFIEQTRQFIVDEVCPGIDPKLFEREVQDQTRSRRR